jgi:hypothetical protein
MCPVRAPRTTGAGAMFSPLLRELIEMRFRWDRPYHVDASRFAAAFWSDATLFETGVFRDGALVWRRIEAQALKLQRVRLTRLPSNSGRHWR